MRSYIEKEKKWRAKMKRWTILWLLSTIISLFLTYIVFDNNLFNTSLFYFMFFFWIASSLSFVYLVFLCTSGMDHRYRMK